MTSCKNNIMNLTSINRRRKAPLAFFLSLSFRFFVYYIIYLVFWGCPSRSDLTDDSPRLCFHLNNIFEKSEPYISPYYDQYAAPYVDVSRPYLNKAQSVIKSAAAPVISKTPELYTAYLEPSISQIVLKAKDVSEPLICDVKEKYTVLVDPYVQTASELSSQYIKPGSKTLYSIVIKLNNKVFIPSYIYSSRYVRSLYNFSKIHIFPVLKGYGDSAYATGQKYFKSLWTWISITITPRLSALYEKTVEPQVNKIVDRVFEHTTSALLQNQSESSKTEESSSVVTTKSESESSVVSDPVSLIIVNETEIETPTIKEHILSSSATSTFFTESTIESEIEATSEKSSEPTQTETIPDLVYQKLNSHHTPNEYNQDVRSQAAIDKKRARRRASSISNELSNWKKIVNKTTQDAFETFKTDISKLKENLIVGSRPRFTRLLKILQKTQKSGYNQLKKLIQDMEYALDQYIADEVDSVDFPWTPASVQASFKKHAEKIRDAALAVREYSEEFAQKALNKTEDVRFGTIDVLDEFSEIILQEIGRKMISDDGEGSSTVHNDRRNAKWSDWKEFRSLKEHLIQTRQDLIDFDIPMDDVNIVLRQAQETANMLAKEAAQYLSEFKSRADTVFITKIRLDREKYESITTEDELNVYDDDVIYEDLESEYEEESNLEQSRFDIQNDDYHLNEENNQRKEQQALNVDILPSQDLNDQFAGAGEAEDDDKNSLSFSETKTESFISEDTAEQEAESESFISEDITEQEAENESQQQFGDETYTDESIIAEEEVDVSVNPDKIDEEVNTLIKSSEIF